MESRFEILDEVDNHVLASDDSEDGGEGYLSWSDSDGEETNEKGESEGKSSIGASLMECEDNKKLT